MSSTEIDRFSTNSYLSTTAIINTNTSSRKGFPVIYNNFDLLQVTVGRIFHIQVPLDTFHDEEDGNTRHLKLGCSSITSDRLSSDSWLQFNSTSQQFYGLVLYGELRTIAKEFLLTATDKDGNTVNDAFTVRLHEATNPVPAIFSLQLTDVSFENFNKDIHNKLALVQSIAGYYGDHDESMIHVQYVVKGSVIFGWSNISLVNCDEASILNVTRKVIMQDGEVQSDFKEKLKPKFTIENAFVNLTSLCTLQSTDKPIIAKVYAQNNSKWMTFVFPSIAVTIIIITIFLVIVFLRRRSGMKLLKEDEKTFRRRKPIILDGEQEMSSLSGKPIQLPDDSPSFNRIAGRNSLVMEDLNEDDNMDGPSPIISSLSYKEIPPSYFDERSKQPPPPYKQPPIY